MPPSAGNHPNTARLTGPRYRITYTTSYVVLLGVGLYLFTEIDELVMSVANICVAAAGFSFAIAEVIEGLIMFAQAMREIIEARRKKRLEKAREEGLQEGRELGHKEERIRLRKDGHDIEEPPPPSRP